ncbi:Uncharacterized protein Adt_39524 [Abeliophyllum distichum]|uniref:Uncharacterized protein n=1 Tax=Abeliophyllum distichum TaxID=126358 RepID=A0ABD1Q5B7_9LAMI
MGLKGLKLYPTFFKHNGQLKTFRNFLFASLNDIPIKAAGYKVVVFSHPFDRPLNILRSSLTRPSPGVGDTTPVANPSRKPAGSRTAHLTSSSLPTSSLQPATAAIPNGLRSEEPRVLEEFSLQFHFPLQETTG